MLLLAAAIAHGISWEEWQLATRSISKQTLRRLPLYLAYLRSLPAGSPDNTSATTMANALGRNCVQVRKDLACVSSSGRPKVGYLVENLIAELEDFLGCNDINEAVIVGAGRLGRALLNYDGFAAYGLQLVAAFDNDPRVYGEECGRIFPMEKLSNMVTRLKASIGIITVPAAQAQVVCDQLVACGILAIWNFAPVHLVVPEGILVQNESMAASLALLSRHLFESKNALRE